MRTLSIQVRTTLVLALTVLVSALVVAGPAFAASGEHEKIPLPETQRDLVGLVILGLTGLAFLAGAYNAFRQLKGEREQASGEYRWR